MQRENDDTAVIDVAVAISKLPRLPCPKLPRFKQSTKLARSY